MMKVDLKNRISLLSEEDRSLVLFKLKELMRKDVDYGNSENSRRLVAFIQPNDSFELQHLKSYLKDRIPDYMIPSNISMVEEIPLLPNGKIDRNKLTKTKKVAIKAGSAIDAGKPNTEIEFQLIEIWQDVLNFKPINIDDNFFEIGGDSILSIQIIAKARKAGILLSPNQLFENQSIVELVSSLSKSKEQKITYKHLVAIQPNGSKPPLICLNAGGYHTFLYNSVANYIDRPIYALQASGIGNDIILHRSIEEMSAIFIDEIKLVQPHGPYHIMAYCFSTAVGLEVANLLLKKNEIVNFMVVDTIADHNQLFAFSQTKARIKGFIEALSKNPRKSLINIIRRRINRHFRLTLKKDKSNHEEKKAVSLRNNYLRIYKNYNWRPYNSTILLLMTKTWNSWVYDAIIESWKKISIKNLKIISIEGRHAELFYEPLVKNTSKVLNECMQDFESNID